MSFYAPQTVSIFPAHFDRSHAGEVTYPNLTAESDVEDLAVREEVGTFDGFHVQVGGDGLKTVVEVEDFMKMQKLSTWLRMRSRA